MDTLPAFYETPGSPADHSTDPPLPLAATAPPPDAADGPPPETRGPASTEPDARSGDSDRVAGRGEEHFRTFMRRSSDGIVITDGEGTILEWNEGQERLTGIPASEAVSRPLWEVQHRLAPEAQRTDAFLREARERIRSGLEEGQGLRRVLQEEIQAPDGTIRVIQSVLLAFECDGRLLAGGISRDVTDRVRLEEALVEANIRLADADRHKNEFLAMLAHELRNPLAVISSAVQILHLHATGDPIANPACEAVERQVAHMARLVDDLLDVSRVTQGKMVLRRETLALTSVFESAVEAARPLIDARSHRLFVSLPRRVLFLQGDRVRLTQAISNVLTNAAKFTPVGGEIHFSAEQDGDEVVVRVRDSGYGIEAQLLPHVFEPFVQARRPADRPRGGLGLGLTIVRALVQLHGGRIEAHSLGPGMGSEFTMWLPLAPAPAEAADGPSTTPPLVVPRQVLVVDDSEDAAEMLGMLLRLDGHTVRLAHSGHAGIEAATTFAPEVALVDIEMPDMDGFEVARRLRQDPGLASMILVALTGYSQEEDVRRSRAAGFDHHLVKPVDMDLLRRLLSGPLPEIR